MNLQKSKSFKKSYINLHGSLTDRTYEKNNKIENISKKESFVWN